MRLRGNTVYLRQRHDMVAPPYVEEFFTIAPAVVVDKQRSSFETLWRQALDLQARAYAQESRF